jgi:hypothetical protein
VVLWEELLLKELEQVKGMWLNWKHIGYEPKKLSLEWLDDILGE